MSLLRGAVADGLEPEDAANQHSGGQCSTVETAQSRAAMRWMMESGEWDMARHWLAGRSSHEVLQRVAMTMHVIRYDNGSEGLPQDQVDQCIVDLNSEVELTGLLFFQEGPTIYHDDSDLAESVSSDFCTIVSTGAVANTVNCYFIPVYEGLCGIANWPASGCQGVTVANGCAASDWNHSTFTHEVGHYFNLRHTHSTSVGDECVDGSNCASAGDGFCDTPADPDIDGVVDWDTCEYLGTEQDACGTGMQYDPDTTNIMSYSTKLCRTHLSTEQQSMVAWTAFSSPYRIDELRGAGEVAVYSPGPAETYCIDHPLVVEWDDNVTSCGGSLRVDLYRYGVFVENIWESTVNDGHTQWNSIPSDMPTGGGYMIRVECLDSGDFGTHAGTFSIEDCDVPEVIYIYDCGDLQAIGSDSQHPEDGHYIIMNNIDCSGYDFMPIGDESLSHFRGTLDGQGYLIEDFDIDLPDREEVGLFSVLEEGAVVRNVTLIDFTIRGKGTMGAFAGVHAGKLVNCHAINGPVSTRQNNAGTEVGALVGYCHPAGMIVGSSFRGDDDVWGESEDVGGIAGKSDGLILWCEFDSETVRSLDDQVGGIVGINFGPIVQSSVRASGDILGSGIRAGGIAGYGGSGSTVTDCVVQADTVEAMDANAGGIVGNFGGGSVLRCLAITEVDGDNSNEGCVVGLGTATDSFWSTASCGGECSGNGTCTNSHGLSDAELALESTFTSDYDAWWDFETIWWMNLDLGHPDLCGIGDRLSAPTGLAAAPSDTGGVLLTWDDVVYEAGCGPFYQVYRVPLSGGLPQTLGTWTTDTSFVDGSTNPFTSYEYSVVAAATLWSDPIYGAFAARESEQSQTITGQAGLPPPYSVEASDAVECQIDVQWNAAAEATHFRVYRSQDGGQPQVITAWQTEMPYSDTEAPLEELVQYWVMAATSSSGNQASGLAGPADGMSVTGAMCPGCVCDLVGGDGVNDEDLMFLINSWIEGTDAGDVNGDGVVNVVDLLTVLQSWGPCN